MRRRRRKPAARKALAGQIVATPSAIRVKFTLARTLATNRTAKEAARTVCWRELPERMGDLNRVRAPKITFAMERNS